MMMRVVVQAATDASVLETTVRPGGLDALLDRFGG